MSIGIDVYLRGKGNGSTRAKQTLSTKQSKEVKDISKKMSALGTFLSSGNVANVAGVMLPQMGSIMAFGKFVEKGVGLSSSVYQAHSGEQMQADNIKALGKAVGSLGLSLIQGGINNWIYNIPQVRRQNYMLDYGQKLYIRNIENEKNSF